MRVDQAKTIYVLGAGAIGLPLAAYLAAAGRTVVAVRTSRKDMTKDTVTVTLRNGADRLTTPVETVSLDRLARLDGTIVIATKSYANKALAFELKDKAATGPLVIMQNGVGVERPFLDAHFSPIYRCVLLITSQAAAEHEFTVRPIASSPIGVIAGDEAGLRKCVDALTTDRFPFHAEANIQREIWKKAIINSAFNSICPLLDVDNGVFVRDPEAAQLACDVVRECLLLTDRLDVGLSENELMEQIMRISKGSDGQLISTLQDIRSARPTEIEFLNLEIARQAASLKPALRLPAVELLGKMIAVKSLQAIKKKLESYDAQSGT
jgi:2-dehydropantoate 2-reductase